jgi:hypothetical protein
MTLLTAGIAIIFAALALAQEGRPWYGYPLTGIGTNIWAPEWYSESIRNFDAEKLAESLAQAGARVAFTFQGFSQDHYGISYFPTRLGPQHRNLNGKDHLQTYVTALHKRNIKIMGYYSFPDKGVWERNTDWRQMDASGKEIHEANFGGPLCPNSPYHEYFLARVSEIVTRYDLDGFMLDSAGFNAAPPGCYCAYCQRKYRERYGRDLPKQRSGYDADWQRFVQFRFDSMQEFYRDVHDTFKRIRPQMLFTHNAFALRGLGWGGGEDYENTVQLDDIVTSIGHWGGGGQLGPTRNTDEIWKTGMLTRFLRGISGKPVWMQMGAYIYNRDYQALPVHELKLAAYTIVENGGSPVYIDNAFPDGSVDTVLTERMSTVLHEVAAKRQYLDLEADVPFAALYYSRDSHILIDSNYQGENRYLSSFEGGYKALMEAHVLFDIVGSLGLTPDRISKYRVIVVPDGVAMSDQEASILRGFVENGGSIVATSRTSLLNANGSPHGSFALADVFGADYENPLNYDTSFIQPQSNAICEGIDVRETIPHRQGQQSKVVARPDARTEARIILPATEIVPGVRSFSFGTDVAPGAVSDYPAIITHSFKQGRSVYFAGDITGAYGRFGDPSLRKLLRNAVRWSAGGSVPLEVEAPLAVEVRCYRQGDRYLVHLMNYISSQLHLWDNVGGPAAEEAIPVTDISIRLQTPRRPSKVFLVSNSQPLPFEMKSGALTVKIPKLEVHDILVVE